MRVPTPFPWELPTRATARMVCTRRRRNTIAPAMHPTESHGQVAARPYLILSGDCGKMLPDIWPAVILQSATLTATCLKATEAGLLLQLRVETMRPALVRSASQ